MTLEKAKLINTDDRKKSIEFMFNPNLLNFSRTISLEQAPGARTKEGENKTSFKHPNPYSLTINNVILDTYESGKNVLEDVGKFTKAVEFSQGGNGKNQRPPIYVFTWGKERYLRCFIKTLSFKLTLFLPDGTPVRAILDLTLEQVDSPTAKPSQGAPSPSQSLREASGRELFLR
ncbi:MAG TPA: hypothetical protein V6D50_21215 [Chroococcales cyanobacterium]